MKITIATTETRKSSNGKGNYTYATGSIQKKDGTTRENVVFMAFGAQRDALKSRLRRGAQLDVKAVFDGGVVKLLGLATPKAAPAPAAA